MEHVLNEEGVTFCDEITLKYSKVDFTEEEIQILKNLEYQLDHRDCNCVFGVMSNGDWIKKESCQYHK